MTAPVCVIIPAFNAAETIGMTVRSVLAEPEVGAVVVVDDASADQTVAAARAADDGSGRLVIHREKVNRGPSAARNRAIEASDLPLLAIVDADDLVVPGRFARLLAAPGTGWDFIADNIAFIPQDKADDPGLAQSLNSAPSLSRRIGLEEFVLGNISSPSRPRAELGFLKPVFRRAFLNEHALRYDTSLRLGEDFVLYARALLNGACFVVRSECGYIACQRERSLSGSHGTADLEALFAAGVQLRSDAAEAGITGGMLTIFDRHRASLADKIAVRRLLDNARNAGKTRAIVGEMGQPLQLLRSARNMRQDRLAASGRPVPAVRMLLEAAFFRS